MSPFDPNVFLNATVTEVNDRRPPLPVENPAASDTYYTAVIGEVKMAGGVSDKDPSKPRNWLQALVPLAIEVPQQLQDAMKLGKTLTLTDRAFIDMTEAGTIDNAPGRNRRQRQYREATNMNKPGDSFSWAKLQGQVVKVKLAHRLIEEPGGSYAIEEVTGILKA